jgi:hypothetical protein
MVSLPGGIPPGIMLHKFLVQTATVSITSAPNLQKGDSAQSKIEKHTAPTVIQGKLHEEA